LRFGGGRGERVLLFQREEEGEIMLASSQLSRGERVVFSFSRRREK